MDEVSVDFKEVLGAPTYCASGVIFGLSEDGTLPEQRLLADIKLQFIRAGGTQLGCPNGGLCQRPVRAALEYGRSLLFADQGYRCKVHLAATRSMGADAVCDVPRWPSDDGDWTEFDLFLSQVLEDTKASGMTGPDVQWDIWNEPDLLTPVIF